MRKLLAVCLIGAFAVHCHAAVLEPADRTRTFSEVLPLRGAVQGPGVLEVNRQVIPVNPDGSFSCGLVLKLGKNLAEIRREGQKQRIRLLRMAAFPDIDSPRHWAQAHIIYTATLGLVEGYPDGNFYPNLSISRGEFATWLARVKNLPLKPLTEDVFFDVPKEHWRAPYIKAVADKGYMRGFANNTFGVEDPISRREAAEVAVESEGFGIVDKISSLFVDVPEAEKASLPIYTAQEKGLVIGVSKKFPIFDPDRSLTRAEAATLISRFWAAQYGIRDLIDHEKGYTDSALCPVNIPPQIVAFSADPGSLSVNHVATVKLLGKIAPRAGFYPISRVRVDLRDIGGLPDAEMFDDGTHGDSVAGDQVYSLNILYTPAESGEKFLRLTATDRLGWEGKAAAGLLVSE